MIPALTSIHLQKLWLPKLAAECSVKTNQGMRHHVQTEAGESAAHNKNEDNYGKWGEGQGKTSSPSNW
eukprot:1585128-Ditylum_brightwellii.AAC.1